MKTSIVTTTIHKPVLLKDYCQNARDFGHKDVNFIVIGDKKTPSEVALFCRELQKTYGYEVFYYGIQEQLELLKDFPALLEYLPFNSIQRRNIGLLQAYRLGSEVIITIDDDNFLIEGQDFIGSHSIIMEEKEFDCISSSSGWFNVCEMLKDENDLPFYHRGFPLGKRWLQSQIRREKRRGKIVVNAGLWLDDPDIDALTRINLPIKAKQMSQEYGKGIALGSDTWSPFNSQNTALRREVIPAYFLSPVIGRYDDIWASYIVKRIANQLGHYIHFGLPLVRQQRNPHNLWKDFDQERLGMETTDMFVETLNNLKLTGKNYQECFAEIWEGLRQNSFSPGNFVEGLEVWSDTFKKL